MTPLATTICGALTAIVLGMAGLFFLPAIPGGATTSPAPFSGLATPAPSNAREAWAMDFLARLGNERPTADTVAMVVAWQTEENTQAAFNPLATSQDMPGATQFNSSKVKNYATYEDGIEATAKTFSYDYAGYAEILEGLRTNDPERALAGLTVSPWAEEAGYGARVRALWRAEGAQPVSSSKCLPTDTGAISAHFNDTNSQYWAAQAGGRHNGTDYSGSQGDPVYAPFALVVEDIQYYGDAGRIGWYVQGRFSDGYLFYAGHLGTVAVSVGQAVPACAVLGTIGEVFHSHLKIASPDKPVPCEATGCDDFETYYQEH